YAVVILLSLIGIGVVVRRALYLIPILINGYHPPSASSGRTAELTKLDDIFAHYPVLTLIHILPALVFIVLGPFQFSKKIRSRHLEWHRRSGRVFLVCGIIVGLTGFVMSFVMPAIGGVNQAASTILFSLFFLFSLYKAY